MLVNLVLNLGFVIPWIQLGWPAPHTGLALATSIAAFINAGLLLLLLRRQGVYMAAPGWARLLLQISGGLLPMTLLLIFAVQDLQHWLDWPAWQRAVFILIWVGAGALVYFVGLYLAGFRLAAFRAEHPGRD